MSSTDSLSPATLSAIATPNPVIIQPPIIAPIVTQTVAPAIDPVFIEPVCSSLIRVVSGCSNCRNKESVEWFVDYRSCKKLCTDCFVDRFKSTLDESSTMDLTVSPTPDSKTGPDEEHVSDYINTGMIMSAPGFLDTFVATLEALVEDVVVDDVSPDDGCDTGTDGKKGDVLDMDGCVQLFEWGTYEPLFYFGGVDENERDMKERLMNEVLVAFASIVVGVSCEKEITRVLLEALKVGTRFGVDTKSNGPSGSEQKMKEDGGGENMQIDQVKVPDEGDEEDEDVVVV
jgi:hypothetical protein